MNEIVWNNILTVIYLLMWIATFGWYHWKHRYMDGGTAIMTTYIMYIIFSLFTLNDDLFNIMYKPLELFPYIYLYSMLLIALSPTFYHHFHPVKCIEPPPSRLLKPFAIFIIFLTFILLPDVVMNFKEGMVRLVTDVDAGEDSYNEQLDEAGEHGSGIANIFAIFFNACYDFTIFVTFYMLTLKKKSFLIIMGLTLSVLLGLMIPIMRGQRGPVIIAILTVWVGYMLFMPYMKKVLVRVVNIIGIVVVMMVAVPITAITMSRFGEKAEGALSFLTWYVGQGNVYFNNYGLDAGGIRYGDRTINLFKRVFFSDTPKNFVERRAKYHNLEIDDDRFTTFVGDFCIDYGPIVAALIFIAFNTWVYSRLRTRGQTLKVHELLLIYFTQCICIQGGMTLFCYSDTGNLRIIVTGLVYAYLCYHEKLLQHFPLKKENPDT